MANDTNRKVEIRDGEELVIHSGGSIQLEDGGIVEGSFGGAASEATGDLASNIGSDGSAAFRVLPIVNCTVADFIANGPKLIYTPVGAADIVQLHFGDAVAMDDNGWNIVFEPFNSTWIDGYNTATSSSLPLEQASLYWNSLGSLQDQNWLISQGSADYTPNLFIAREPVIAYLQSSNGPFGADNVAYVRSAIGAWQADHEYALGDAIDDGNGHVQIVTTAGTSDSTEPDPWDNAGSTTTDNTVEWQDAGLVPVAGSIEVFALVATPPSA